MGFIRAIIKLPWPLWILGIAGYLYFTYHTWETEEYLPLKAQIETTSEQLAKLQKENKEAETFEKERDSNIQQLQNLAEEFNKALEKLPKSSDTPGILSNLAEISDRVGVDFNRFEPGKPAVNGFLMETPFKVELKGTFVQIMSFLDEVAHLKRIVSGKSVTFKDPVLRGSKAVVTAEAVLVTYYFDESRGASANTSSSTAQPISINSGTKDSNSSNKNPNSKDNANPDGAKGP